MNGRLNGRVLVGLTICTIVAILLGTTLGHAQTPARVTSGQMALYSFDEGSGITVTDISGIGTPLDLTIEDANAVTWLPGGGLSIDTSTRIASPGAATKIFDAVQASQALTIEAWVKPSNTTQSGPARIVTLSTNANNQNFTLGQGLCCGDGSDLYDVRFRSTTTNSNGNPSLSTLPGTLTTNLTHVVYTRSASGETRIYLDGTLLDQGTTAGAISNWGSTDRLGFGNEFEADRAWLGELHLVALFDRVLTPNDVAQNFTAGPVVQAVGPAISMTKEPVTQSVLSGSAASFTLTVRNTGDVDLVNVVVTDPDCTVTLIDQGDGDTTLNPAEEWRYTCTMSNIINPITNTATVDAEDSTGVTVSDSDSAEVTIVTNLRVTNGQQVLYTFFEGSGNMITDISGVGDPLNLTIADENAVTWLPNGGITINSDTLIASPGPGFKIRNAVQNTGEISIEAWVRPASTTLAQDGPARIVTLSKNNLSRSFTLGQGLCCNGDSDLYDVRFRSTATNLNGNPSLSSLAGSLVTALTHVVYTRDTQGATKLYVDDALVAQGTTTGSLSPWGTSDRLALGNEINGDRLWLGDLRLVAIFNRVLSAAEVTQNFITGPTGTGPLPNQPPTVDAGIDQTVTPPAVATLDGTISDDGSPNPPNVVTTTWSKVSGPGTVTFGDANAVDTTASFSGSGTYVLRLTADDSDLSTFDDVTVTVGTSAPITVTFRNDEQGYVGTEDALIRSTNPDTPRGKAPEFNWSGGENKSALIQFQDIFGAGAGQIPVGVNITSATLTVEVFDDGDAADISEVAVAWDEDITFNTFGSIPGVQPEDLNASIGNTGFVNTGLLTIDVTSSLQAWVTDPNANRGWIFVPTGTKVVGVRSSEYSIVADRPQLAVTYALSSNAPPVADAGPDQTVPRNTLVTLDGSASSDPDTDPLTFNWAITNQPAGSTATLTNPTSVNPTFTPDVNGDYTIDLIVNDGTENSAPDTVVITGENTQPVANAGGDQNVAKGVTVQLDGSSSSDTNSDPLTFTWSLIQQPGSSTATLSDVALVNPTFVADQEGTYIAQLIVNDGTVDSASDTVTITAVNNPPVLDPIGDKTIPLGQTLTFILTGSDPEGLPVTFSALPLPLPEGMTMNGTSGVVNFQPSANQVGTFPITFSVSDGAQTDSETINITVQGAAPGGITELTGRILDTTDFTSTGTETPVVGATVSIIGSGVSTTSDVQGFFTLSGVPAGGQIFDIDASTANPAPDSSVYAGFREQLSLIANVNNVVDRPFFIPRIDPASQMLVNGVPVTGVDPNNTTRVENPNIGVRFDVPAHTAKMNGLDYTGPLSISEVPDGLAPAALPDELDPGFLITIQPPGVTFATPVPITFPNSVDNIPIGKEADLWSLDPSTGQFHIVGTLTPSGANLVTFQGGVRAADWHAALPPPPVEMAPSTGPVGFGSTYGFRGDPNSAIDPTTQPDIMNAEMQSANPSSCATGSETVICSGQLRVEHAIPTYQSLGLARGVQLRYSHLSADPRPIIFNNPTIPQRSVIPLTMSAQLSVGGINQGPEIFTDTSGLPQAGDKLLRQAVQFDATGFPTGVYPFALRITNQFAASSMGTTVRDTVFVRNDQQSPFGAGWTLPGVDRVSLQFNGDALLETGEGGLSLFRSPVVGAFESQGDFFFSGSPKASTKSFLKDLNGDTHLDLIAGGTIFSSPDAQVIVHLGNGDGTFTFHGLTPFGVGAISDLVTGDFDGDGNLDLAAVSLNQNNLRVLWGTGTGDFTDLEIFASPSTSSFQSLEVGDFNENSNLDIITGMSGGVDNVILWDGQGLRGAGAFQSSILPTINAVNFQDMAVIDVDQDNHLDVVTTNGSQYFVLFGDGAGNFPTVTQNGGFAFLREMTAGDFNQNGFPDLAITERNNGRFEVLVFENNRFGGFSAPQRVELGNQTSSSFLTDIQAADFTGDGQPELVITDPLNAGMGFMIARHEVRGFVVAGALDTVGTLVLQSAAPGDVDGDGIQDIVFVMDANSSGRAEVFKNFGLDLNEFLSPPGDFSTLTANVDGTFTRRLKIGETFQFDLNGLQTGMSDRNGNTTTYVYNLQQQLEKIVDPANLETLFDYGGGTQLQKITDPAGRETRFEIDAVGDLVKITDPDLSEREFTYDTFHRVTQQESKRGFFTQYEYNFAGRHTKTIRPDGSTRLIDPSETKGVADVANGKGTDATPIPPVLADDLESTFTDGNNNVTVFKTGRFGQITVRTDPLGRTTTTAPNTDGNAVTITGPNGLVTEREYDDQGNVLTLTEAKNQSGHRVTTFEYDATFHLVTKITDPANKITTIQRDANGNPKRIINPLLDERVRTFDSRGLVLTDTDENQKTTIFTYDVNGNVETITDPEGSITRFIRDTAGNVLTMIEGETTPEQRTRTFTYDAMNRLASATDGTPALTQFRYDVEGNLDETELPTGEIEQRTYDTLNLVATINDPLRGLTQFTYDPNGNLTQTENALTDATTFDYDIANQLTKITDVLTGEQVFTYDAAGNVETFIDARNKTTTFEYDLLSRQRKRTNHVSQVTTFDYDSRDNVTTTRDPKNQVISRSYDDLSRLIRMQRLDTLEEILGVDYDAVGNPTVVSDADSQVTFTYDGVNRVKTATTANLGAQPLVTLTSTYDAVGNRRSLEDILSSITSYDYDLAGRLTSLITPFNQPATAISLAYDAAGRLDLVTFPNGVVSDYAYDIQGRLSDLTHTLGANPSFTDFGYTYNPAGNITAILDQVTPTENRAFTYDALQRLKTGGTTAASETYDYDAVGNRTTSFLSTAHTHDDVNRLTADDQFTYTYDANGNLETKTSVANPTEVTTYHWDFQDQLTQIDFPDGTSTTYKYDGLGRRIEKNVNGTITRYIYDGEDIVLEYDETNTFVARYSHGDQTDQPLAVQRAGVGFFYYQADHQGSITHLTDSSGTIANSYTYDSYGRTLTLSETVIQPYTYTGRELDPESGLYYYRARYYDPQRRGQIFG